MSQPKPRKLVYYVAISIDHYIARADGSVDGFPSEGQHAVDYFHSLRDYDTVLMGKATYEWGYQYGAKPGEPSPTYPYMMHYIFSKTMPHFQSERLQVIREDAPTFVQGLKQQDGDSIYLCGGGHLAGSLLDHALIDELILKIYPVAFGSGIPLFGDSKRDFALSLYSSKTYANGAIFAHYAIDYGV